VVEGQGKIDLIAAENPDIPGVIPRLRPAGRPGHEDRRDRVLTGVPIRIGIRVELISKLDPERCLLLGFADRRFFEGFSVIHESAGKCPAVRRVLSSDEDDPVLSRRVLDLDDDVHGRDGVPVGPEAFLFVHGCRYSIRKAEAGPFSRGTKAYRCPFAGTDEACSSGLSRLMGFGIKFALIYNDFQAKDQSDEKERF